MDRLLRTLNNGIEMWVDDFGLYSLKRGDKRVYFTSGEYAAMNEEMARWLLETCS